MAKKKKKKKKKRRMKKEKKKKIHKLKKVQQQETMPRRCRLKKRKPYQRRFGDDPRTLLYTAEEGSAEPPTHHPTFLAEKSLRYVRPYFKAVQNGLQSLEGLPLSRALALLHPGTHPHPEAFWECAIREKRVVLLHRGLSLPGRQRRGETRHGAKDVWRPGGLRTCRARYGWSRGRTG